MSVKNTNNEINKNQQEILFQPISYNIAENSKNQHSFVKSDLIKKINIKTMNLKNFLRKSLF